MLLINVIQKIPLQLPVSQTDFRLRLTDAGLRLQFCALFHGHHQLKKEMASLLLCAVCDILGKWKSRVQRGASMSTGSEAFLKHLK